MIKRKQSVRSLKRSKTASKEAPEPSSRRGSLKRSLADEIIGGLEEGIAHARGEIKLRARVIESAAPIPAAVDVHAIREKSGFSQSEFAARYGFSIRTLQEWEQGRARPDGAVRAYLIVIDRNPDAVRQALTG
jgi:putative transcriptional regulator